MEKDPDEKKQDLTKSAFQKAVKEDLIKSLDEIDVTLRKTSRRFFDRFVDAAVEKVTQIWENNKIIVQEKIREGNKKDARKKSRRRKRSP